jgi:hypothetical protein
MFPSSQQFAWNLVLGAETHSGLKVPIYNPFYLNYAYNGFARIANNVPLSVADE